MTQEQLENLDSENKAADQETEDNLDSELSPSEETPDLDELWSEEAEDEEGIAALKQQGRQLAEQNKKLGDQLKKVDEINKRLFARAKKAEGQKPSSKAGLPEEELTSAVNKVLDEREWSSLELSEDLKRELKSYAQANNLTAKQALASPFRTFLQGQEEAKRKVEEASIGGKRRAPSMQDFSKVSPGNFDLSTPEGQEQYEKYRGWLKTQE